MTKQHAQSIQDAHDQFMKDLETQVAWPMRHQYLSQEGLAEVRALWLTAVAEAVGILYAGYQVGQRAEQIVDSVTKALDAVAAIGQGLATVIGKLDQILDQLAEMLKAINRRIDRTACLGHMAKAQTWMGFVAASAQKLKLYAPDPTGPYAVAELNHLHNAMVQMVVELNAYLAIELAEGEPTSATFFQICPMVAIYAQGWNITESFKPQALKTHVTSSSAHVSFLDVIRRSFVHMDQQRAMMEAAATPAAIGLPIPGEAHRLIDAPHRPGGRFAWMGDPYMNYYPDDRKYDNCFTASARSGELLITQRTAVFNTGGGGRYAYSWVSAATPPEPLSDPTLAARAIAAFNFRRVMEQERLAFVAEAKAYQSYRSKAEEILAEPPGW